MKVAWLSLQGRSCVGGTVSCKCPGSATLCSMPRARFFSNLTCEGEGGEYTFSPRCYCVYTQLENRRVVPAALSMEWLGQPPAFKFKHQGLASHSTSNKDNEPLFPSRGLLKLEVCVFYQEFKTVTRINSPQLLVILKLLAMSE